jgi:hypothetical protein
MDIVLDSNVIISDPWFRSQKMRVLLNFAEKSVSQVLLLEPVEMEIRAHLKREVRGSIDGIQTAIRNAERLGIKSNIVFDPTATFESTIEKWDLSLESLVEQKKLYRVPLSPSILSEALRRATERIPPCNDSGKELRDTIIWLSFIESCKKRQLVGEYVFISQNTKDFAAPDKISLRLELEKDFTESGLNVLYYPSLESFNKARAERSEHITLQWVKERLDLKDVKEAVEKKLAHQASLFVISGDHRKHFKPYLVQNITTLELELTEPIYVWNTDQQGIEISVGIGIYAEADIDCEFIGDRHYLDYDDSEEEQYYDRTLSSYAELGGSISVTVADESLQFIGIEDVYRS